MTSRALASSANTPAEPKPGRPADRPPTEAEINPPPASAASSTPRPKQLRQLANKPINEAPS